MMSEDKTFDVALDRIEEDYKGISDFVEANNKIPYSQFDSELLRRVNLFALPENIDFDALNEALEVIIKSLPAIKRIFANPITHIKTTSEILPVESVRVINNETIVYASSHSELWENITADGLKPRKLLTQDNRDNYATYENLIFAKTVDTVLQFVGKNIAFCLNIFSSPRNTCSCHRVNCVCMVNKIFIKSTFFYLINSQIFCKLIKNSRNHFHMGKFFCAYISKKCLCFVVRCRITLI